MISVKNAISSIIIVAGLTACQTYGEAADDPATLAHTSATQASRGGLLAEALCSGCHGIKLGQVSPNPEAPSLADVANSKGVTEKTLGNFLQNAHNFPERMNFEVAAEDANMLAAYIITLQSDDYTPAI